MDATHEFDGSGDVHDQGGEGHRHQLRVDCAGGTQSVQLLFL